VLYTALGYDSDDIKDRVKKEGRKKEFMFGEEGRKPS